MEHESDRVAGALDAALARHMDGRTPPPVARASRISVNGRQGIEWRRDHLVRCPTKPCAAGAAVVWLHGFGDHAEGWIDDDTGSGFGKEIMSQPDVRWVFLRAPSLPQPCFRGALVPAWGEYKDKKTTRLGSVDHESTSIVADDILIEAHRVIHEIVAAGVSPRHIAVGGFSMGATAAAEIALTYPGGPLGSLVMLNGWLSPGAKAALVSTDPGEAATRARDDTRRHLRVLVSHGVRDEQVAFELGEEATRGLRAAGMDVRFEIDQLMHVRSGFGPGRAHAETFLQDFFTRSRDEPAPAALPARRPKRPRSATRPGKLRSARAGPGQVLSSLADPEAATRYS